MRQRITELRGKAIPEPRPWARFMQRRLSPAPSRHVAATERRLASLSARLAGQRNCCAPAWTSPPKGRTRCCWPKLTRGRNAIAPPNPTVEGPTCRSRRSRITSSACCCTQRQATKAPTCHQPEIARRRAEFRWCSGPCGAPQRIRKNHTMNFWDQRFADRAAVRHQT